MESDQDLKYMRRCFDLALKGAGSVSPNPLVGSVITKNGKVISEGWHQKFGAPHAEAEAISNAKESLQGATLYCNLEPCCHTEKKTPPCVPLIIESGIKRVVISSIDPNPKVAGKGITQLQNAGVEVITGVLDEDGKELNKFFFKFITKKNPFVTLKIAQSVDGKISSEAEKQTWLTGKSSARFVHLQRAIYDAVLIGAGTVNVDNPQLNVRHVDGRNPKRIIVDGNLGLNLDVTCLNDSDKMNTSVFVSENVKEDRIVKLREKGVNTIQVSSDKNGIIDIELILTKLAEENISSVLVEGGKEIFSQFIQKNLFDELIILQAPLILGKGIDAFDNFDEISLELYSTEKLGRDLKYVYKNRSRA